MIDYRKKTKDILFFVYINKYVCRKLMRSIGFSYDNTGRLVRKLINEGYLEEIYIPKPYYELYLTITDKGEKEIKDIIRPYVKVDRFIKNNMRGTAGQYRQFKMSCVIQLLITYYPEYLNNYIRQIMEKEKENKKADGNAVITKEDKLASIRNEIAKRKDKNGNWMISLREMRSLDKSGLRNLPQVRAQFALKTDNGIFAIYNHNKHKMRTYGESEERFRDFLSEITWYREEVNSISFGRSYKVLYDTIDDSIWGKGTFVLSRKAYKKQYFIPLHYEGKKQFELLTIKNFREKIRENLVSKEEQERTKNTVYDGAAEDGNLIYLGFATDINEIDIVYTGMKYLHTESKITIYCLPHQYDFYKTLFGERADVLTIDTDKVIMSIKNT